MIALLTDQEVAGAPDYKVTSGGDYELGDLVECYLKPDADMGDPSREGYEPPPASRTFFAYYIAGLDPKGSK